MLRPHGRVVGGPDTPRGGQRPRTRVFPPRRRERGPVARMRTRIPADPPPCWLGRLRSIPPEAESPDAGSPRAAHPTPRTRQSLTLQSRLTPARPIVRPNAARRALIIRNSPHCISPHLPSWRDRPIVAESSCAATRRRHFPRNLIFRNLRKNTVNLSIFIEFYRNSIFLSEATGCAIIHARAPGSATAIAGKCGSISNGDAENFARTPGGNDERVAANAGKCAPPRNLQLPSSGGIAFTPLSRGGRGGWFSSRGSPLPARRADLLKQLRAHVLAAHHHLHDDEQVAGFSLPQITDSTLLGGVRVIRATLFLRGPHQGIVYGSHPVIRSFVLHRVFRQRDRL